MVKTKYSDNTVNLLVALNASLLYNYLSKYCKNSMTAVFLCQVFGVGLMKT